MAVMITGGAGYIGSHAVQRMLRDGHDVVAYDSLGRGHREPMEILKQQDYGQKLTFVEGNIADRDKLVSLIKDHGIDTIMHFAALAYVGESVTEPLTYYRNNTAGTLSLLEAVEETCVPRFVFSSTCATYGEPTPPIREDAAQAPINPYGVSKLHVEHMLKDFGTKQALAGNDFGWAALRYFNVAGCDRSGLLGEDHHPETHLIPVILNTVLDKRDSITIFGSDYPTPDGTCIRDYVHVEDLVDAHVEVMKALRPGDARMYNLGIGRGYSVREIIDAVKRVTGKDFTVLEGERRAGDPPELYADPAKIQTELGWKASITDVDEVIASAWNWFQKNPKGYAGG